MQIRKQVWVKLQKSVRHMTVKPEQTHSKSVSFFDQLISNVEKYQDQFVSDRVPYYEQHFQHRKRVEVHRRRKEQLESAAKQEMPVEQNEFDELYSMLKSVSDWNQSKIEAIQGINNDHKNRKQKAQTCRKMLTRKNISDLYGLGMKVNDFQDEMQLEEILESQGQTATRNKNKIYQSVLDSRTKHSPSSGSAPDISESVVQLNLKPLQRTFDANYKFSSKI